MREVTLAQNTTTTTTTPTTVATTTTAAATTTTTTTATAPAAPVTTATSAAPTAEPQYFPPFQIVLVPDGSTTGAEIRDGTSLVHILLRGAHWVPRVGSYLELSPIQLETSEMPVVVTNFSMSPFAPEQGGTGGWDKLVVTKLSSWGEPLNQEDEKLDATVQVSLTNGDLRCYILIMSVSEGNLICNGTVYPSEEEKLNMLLPPYVLRSLHSSAAVTGTPQNASGHNNGDVDFPTNTPFTLVVIIKPEEHTLQLVRFTSTSILALVALVAIVVGKEPHIHIMSVARMSLIGRLLECSDEVDLILHPTHVRLGRGTEKGRYFGCLIFNTAITMGLIIGHNVIARVAPRLLPDPPPATQFVIAGALLPGIALAGLKTITLESSPVQFFLAIVVMLLFIGAWLGCYWVTARDKNFFQRYGRWQHKTDPFFMLRWRVFFTSYKASRRFYVLIEIFVTLFMAVPSGITLSKWLSREESCRYRSIAMLSLVGVDALIVLALKPYAIKIDTVAYTISKLFEMSVAAAALARAYHQVAAFEIGTAFWIAGALFVAAWQSVRAYNKAQYNSQQNEFFLTTADTADYTFHELGDDDENTMRTLADTDGGDGGGGGGGHRPIARHGKTTLASLFPESDYNDEEYNDEVGEAAETAELRHMLHPELENISSSAPNPSATTATATAAAAAAAAASPKKRATQLLEEIENEVSSSFAGPSGGGGGGNSNSTDKVATAVSKTAAPSARPSFPEEDDDAFEMELLAQAPRLQLSERNETSNAAAIPSSVDSRSISIAKDDPMLEFWDALTDSAGRAASTGARHSHAMTRSFGSTKLGADGSTGAGAGAGTGADTSLPLLGGSSVEGPTAESTALRFQGDGREVPPPIESQLRASGTVSFTPKIQVRDASETRRFSEAKPCRFQDSVEAPAAGIDIPNLTGASEGRRTSSVGLPSIASRSSPARSAASAMTPGPADPGDSAFLQPRFISDEYAQRFAKVGEVAEDGVGIDL